MSLTSGNLHPGKLDRRVVLRYKSVTRDAMGGEVVEWVNAATVWASNAPLSGGRMYSAEAKHYDSSLQYTIRHRTDVEAGWRLVHGDDVFEITFTDPGESRNQYLTLSLRAVDQSIGYADRDTGTDVLLLEGTDATALFLLEDESNLLLETAA